MHVNETSFIKQYVALLADTNLYILIQLYSIQPIHGVSQLFVKIGFIARWISYSLMGGNS